MLWGLDLNSDVLWKPLLDFLHSYSDFMDGTVSHVNIKINHPDNVVTLQIYLIVMNFSPRDSE